ncbi:MAG: signal peptidase II [Candidatus Anoxymicrobium japonicum]|uniref:Lipoprotein signal peptidase n=1 Tax=Candidatus Anoxymicrobium japonicum TaxID=2013648 RepID=A0A2N3G6A6_9ACTN|nr:MAG: signal peptidase II [Candidatus Anoxymicrobium japonicum]
MVRIKLLERSTKNMSAFSVAVAASTIALDQISKALVVACLETGQSISLLPHVISLTHSTNTGGAFGIMRQGNQVIFLVATGIIALGFAWFIVSRRAGDPLSFIGLGLLVGGSLGNLIDRIARQKVVDFLDLGWWPVFNVADVAIVIGVIILVIVLAFDFMREKSLEIENQ